jgi:hypothetical protein
MPESDSLEECWKAACNNVMACNNVIDSLGTTLWRFGCLNEIHLIERELVRLRDAGYPPADKEFVLKNGPCSIPRSPGVPHA